MAFPSRRERERLQRQLELDCREPPIVQTKQDIGYILALPIRIPPATAVTQLSDTGMPLQ
jgi:hypothetical protein